MSRPVWKSAPEVQTNRRLLEPCSNLQIVRIWFGRSRKKRRKKVKNGAKRDQDFPKTARH